jgi:hypothetical protein
MINRGTALLVFEQHKVVPNNSTLPTNYAPIAKLIPSRIDAA